MLIIDKPKFKIALSLLFFVILALNLTMCKSPAQTKETMQVQIISEQIV